MGDQSQEKTVKIQPILRIVAPENQTGPQTAGRMRRNCQRLSLLPLIVHEKMLKDFIWSRQARTFWAIGVNYIPGFYAIRKEP